MQFSSLKAIIKDFNKTLKTTITQQTIAILQGTDQGPSTFWTFNQRNILLNSNFQPHLLTKVVEGWMKEYVIEQ